MGSEKNIIQEKLEKNESERLELVKTVTELISNVNTMKAALEEEAVKQKATIKSKDEEIKQLKKTNCEKISELEDERKKAEEDKNVEMEKSKEETADLKEKISTLEKEIVQAEMKYTDLQEINEAN